MQKRVAAIHDISCFGKCSLTVALPIISAAGIECSAIPTAVLSTHTGGFSGFTFRDLTEDIMPVAEHWKKENLTFDAVYTGYLGSIEQIDLVCKAIDTFGTENTLLVVDPVMADHGKLYGGFPEDFPQKMKTLCARADIITPNITEAAFMTGMEYKAPPYDKKYIEDMMNALMQITKGKIILTGVAFNDSQVGAACYEGSEIEYVFTERINAAYHGTGDIFTSALTSAILLDFPLKDAAHIAARFTCNCIGRTLNYHPEMTYGVNFEAEIPTFLKLLNKI